MVVKLEDIKKYAEFVKNINESKLENITLTDNNRSLNIDNDDIHNFKFTGLNNIDFFMFYFINN